MLNSTDILKQKCNEYNDMLKNKLSYKDFNTISEHYKKYYLSHEDIYKCNIEEPKEDNNNNNIENFQSHSSQTELPQPSQIPQSHSSQTELPQTSQTKTKTKNFYTLNKVVEKNKQEISNVINYLKQHNFDKMSSSIMKSIHTNDSQESIKIKINNIILFIIGLMTEMKINQKSDAFEPIVKIIKPIILSLSKKKSEYEKETKLLEDLINPNQNPNLNPKGGKSKKNRKPRKKSRKQTRRYRKTKK